MNVFESNISESKIEEEILFSLNKLEPNFIISKAFMNLNFQVLNFALLVLILDSFLHESHRLGIHLIYAE